jgi:hypothetical protein
MTSPTSQELSKTFSIWYYKHKNDPAFNAEDPSEEHELDYEKILAEVMAENNKNQDL